MSAYYGGTRERTQECSGRPPQNVGTKARDRKSSLVVTRSKLFTQMHLETEILAPATRREIKSRNSPGAAILLPLPTMGP